jgi:hypothetical protein
MKQGKGFQWIALFLLFALLAAFGGGCGGGGGSSSGGVDAPATVPDTGLKAGAGIGVIDLTGLPFDGAAQSEGFGGVHDNPHARVLVLETSEETVAIVTLELVKPDDDGVIHVSKSIVATTLGIPEANVWIHVTHTITTPHPQRDDWKPILSNAVNAAVTEAAQQAKDSLQPAVAGAGKGVLNVNRNRNVLFVDGWNLGLTNFTGPSDKELSILQVDSAATGKPIGFLMNYGMKPDVINNTPDSRNGTARLISSDAPGFFSLAMEEKYGAPALYIMGAAADQIPQKTAYYYTADAVTGDAVLVALSVEEGLALAEEVAAEMTTVATKIVENEISTKSGQKLAITSDSFMWPPAAGRDGSVGDPIPFDVKVIRFGDLALVGVGPEVFASLGLAVKNNSPFATTMIVSCSDNITNYLPDDQAYIDSVTSAVEGTTKSAYARGAGSQFVLKAVNMLNGLFGK